MQNQFRLEIESAEIIRKSLQHCKTHTEFEKFQAQGNVTE